MPRPRLTAYTGTRVLQRCRPGDWCAACTHLPAVRAKACDLLGSPNADERLQLCSVKRPHRDRSLGDVGPECVPAAAPSCCGLSDDPFGWFWPGASTHLPCWLRNDSG